MNAREQSTDRLSRVGFCLGLLAIMGGLAIGAVPLARPEGLGISPVIAADSQHLWPSHLQARVALVGGCVVLSLAILRAIGGTQTRRGPDLRSLCLAAMVTCLGSVTLAVSLNWAIVTGRAPDYVGLVPAVLDLGAAALYAVVIAGLLSSADGPIAMDMLLRSGAVWLLVYAVGQLAWTAGRIFLDNDKLLWFVGASTLETALLGFLVPTGFGLVLEGVPGVARTRTMLRSVPQTFQALNLCLLLWLGLRVWCARYPGGYQQLVLALVGLGIFACVLKTTLDSGLLNPWRRAALGPVVMKPALALLRSSLAFLIVAAALYAVTALLLAGSSTTPPREQLFAAVVLALTLGFFTALTSGLMGAVYVGQSKHLFSSRLLAWGHWWLTAGTALGIALWLLTTMVKPSLNAFILAAEVAVAVGLILLVAWISGGDEGRPTTH